ncbi:MAG: 3-isopropylmalate dehydratase small subunit [Kiritimatiellae bacterium]|nr:3-isopropylmalate dehydratase small subunit [Kiritimatiellia bacterium]
MEAFNIHKGLIATLDRANVDTDQIIPKQFLKSIKKTGFGQGLFFDWRYGLDGKPDPSFELNHEKFKGASVLIVRNNFGCGSSREHAVWAVQQDGYKVVIAPWVERNGTRIPGFADIFQNNAAKNGLLTIELSESEVGEIFQHIERSEGLEITVNLETQSLLVHTNPEISFHFDIDPSVKEHLIRGLDQIALAFEHENAIRDFEFSHNVQISIQQS